MDIHVVGFEKTQDEVVAGLQKHFGLPRSAALRFVNSVPRVARHCAGYAEAKAYEQALRAVGAVVQLRPAVSLAPSAEFDVPSLPAPPMARSAQPGFDSSATLAERIPRAPGVPAEAWHKPPPGSFDELGNPVLVRDNQPMIAEFFSDAPLKPEEQISSAREDLRLQLSSAPSSGMAVGLNDGSSPPSGRPSGGMSSTPTAVRPVTSVPPKRGSGLLLVALTLALGGGALWFFQRGDDEAARLERLADASGIELGKYEPATEFLGNGAIAGLTNDRAKDLLSAARITGARTIHAIGIHDSPGGRVADGLLVELPQDAEQRNALLWLQARAQQSEQRITDDRGQQFVVISGPQRAMGAAASDTGK